MEPCCADCAHWDSRDALVGHCQEITDHLANDPALAVFGLAPCRTSARGGCLRFELSEEAKERFEAEREHERSLAGEAGWSYPMSLG